MKAKFSLVEISLLLILSLGKPLVLPARLVARQWINRCHSRYKNLIRLGVSDAQTWMMAAFRKEPCALSNMKPLKIAYPIGALPGKENRVC